MENNVTFTRHQVNLEKATLEMNKQTYIFELMTLPFTSKTYKTPITNTSFNLKAMNMNLVLKVYTEIKAIKTTCIELGIEPKHENVLCDDFIRALRIVKNIIKVEEKLSILSSISYHLTEYNRSIQKLEHYENLYKALQL